MLALKAAVCRSCLANGDARSDNRHVSQPAFYGVGFTLPSRKTKPSPSLILLVYSLSTITAVLQSSLDLGITLLQTALYWLRSY